MPENHAPVEARLLHLARDMREKANGESEPVGGMREYVRDHASSLEEFARQVRDEYSRVQSRENDALVRITDMARDAYNEASRMIADAHNWANSGDGIDVMRPDAESIVRERRDAANAMELSLLRGLAHLCFIAQAHDGPLEIWKDSACSFFWKHASGYHGGLIFHRSHGLTNDGGPALGTWSLHT